MDMSEGEEGVKNYVTVDDDLPYSYYYRIIALLLGIADGFL